MDRLQILYFPETVLKVETFKKLLLFFDSITYFQAMEEDGEPDDSLSAAGLCKGYAPAPLGEDRDRFKRLIKDLHGHEGEFYSGYLSAIVAEAGVDSDEAAVWSLISSMSKIGKEDQDDLEEKKVLWHARLMLKLAEELDRDEDELAQGLAAISSKEAELLESLKGEDADDEELFRLPLDAMAPSSYTLERTEQLLKAWGRLYLKDEKPNKVLATANLTAAKSLFDNYEEYAGVKPLKICSIVLPVVDSSEDRYLEQRDMLRKKQEEAIAVFKQGVEELVRGENFDTHGIEKLKKACNLWEQNEQGKAEAVVSLYLLQGMTLGDYFAKICSGKARSTLRNGLAAGIVAVLNGQELSG